MRNPVAVLAVSLVLSACQQDVSVNDYFPMHPGITWHYIVSETSRGQLNTRPFSIENMARTSFEGKYFNMPITVRRTSDGTDYFIVDAEDGRYRIAKKTLADSTPVMDQKEIKVLPHPDSFEVGHNWFNEAHTVTLTGIKNDTVPDPQDIVFTMEYHIASTDDNLEVPAGKFEHCIRVEGHGTFNLYVDPKLGYQDIDIQQTEWYAPSIGLVKLVRKEPQQAGLFTGGTLRFELTSMER